MLSAGPEQSQLMQMMATLKGRNVAITGADDWREASQFEGDRHPLCRFENDADGGDQRKRSESHA